MRVGVALLAVALALGAPRAARAQVPSSQACGEIIDKDQASRLDRASEHFLKGDELYAAGQYELAIQEYKAAYCLLPAFEPTKMIAQSYLGLVDYESALDWFELYVRLLPPNDPDRQLTANRIDRLRKLPARVSVSTEPPGAKVTLKSDQLAIEGVADAADPMKAPDGKYTLRVEKAGYEPFEREITVRIGQPYSYSFRLEQQRGTLRVSTNPGSARVFLDDKLVGVGVFSGEVPIGGHKLTVEATGRPPEVRQVEGFAEELPTVHGRLRPAPASGGWGLIGAMTTYGAVAGGSLGTAVFDQDSGGVLLLTVGAAGVSFAGGYFGAGDHIPVGRTSYIIGGTLWGAVEGIAVGSIFDPSGSGDVVSGTAVAGLTIGAVVTALSAKRLDLDAGDAALLNSGGIWGSMTGLFLWGLFDSTDELFAPFLLGGLNAGLLAGAAAGYRYDFSRGHVALIDVAGLAGAVTGLALSNAFTGNNADSAADEDTQLHFAFGGMLVGLLAGAVVTRNMDVDRAPTELGAARLMPTVVVAPSGRSVVGLGTGWRF